MSGMTRESLEDTSLVYWLKDLFKDYPDVTITDAYPEMDLKLPTVAVENGDITIFPYELGNRTGRMDRLWTIIVFANNKVQRDDFASIIRKNLESGIPVYDYNQGFPPTNSPPQIDLLRPESIIIRPIRIFPDLTEKLYWRADISFLTKSI